MNDWIDKDKLLKYVRKELVEAKQNYELFKKKEGLHNPDTQHLKGAFDVLDELEGRITGGWFD